MNSRMIAAHFSILSNSVLQNLIDGLNVDQAFATVDCGQDLVFLPGACGAARPLFPCRRGRPAGTCGPAADGVPRRRRACPPAPRDKEIVAQGLRHVGLRAYSSPGEIGGLVLGVVLEQRQEDADLQVLVGELVDLSDSVGHEDGVVGDALEECGSARVHGQDGGFETHLAAPVEVLQIGEGGDVAGDDFVADQLQELGHRDFERGIDFVSGFVFGRAIGAAGAAEIVHRTGEPGFADGQEFDVGARDGVQLGREMGHDVPRGEGVEIGDDGGAEGADGGHGDGAGFAPAVNGGEQLVAGAARGIRRGPAVRRRARVSRRDADGSGGRPVEASTQRS